MSGVRGRQAVAAELISDSCNIWQTFDSCRQLIALCRAMDIKAAPDGAEMGMCRVLGIVTDALEHLERQVRVLLKADQKEAQP